MARSPAPSRWTAADFDLLAAYVRGKAGLVFSSARRAEVESTVLRAVERAGAPDPRAFLALLDTDAALRDELIASLTIGESYFLRDPAQFELLRDSVIPDLLRAHGDAEPIRAWSAGCSTGEEPYSLAIVFHESGLAERTRILGTDVSRPRLAAARLAQYGAWSLRGASDELKRSYFQRRGKEYQLVPQIRRLVEFSYLNLAEDEYPSLASKVWGMDIVFCRNVLIYLDEPTVALVAQRLLATLSDTGWLLLGASDPPLAEIVRCEVVVTGAGLAYRRWVPGRTGAAPVEPTPTPEPRREPLPATPPAEPIALPPPGDDLVPAGTERATRPPRVAEWTARARALANGGHAAEADAVITLALEAHPDDAELHYLRGLLLLEAGRAKDAAAAARRALYLDRELVVAHLLLGHVQRRLGSDTAAARAYRNAIALLDGLPPDQPLAASDGETAARLRELASVQLELLRETAR